MAKKDLNIAPYYDDYGSEGYAESKKYTQLLAIPGRVAQAREFTQMQSVMKNIIKSVGDSILKDGDIVEGCQVISQKSENGEWFVTVTPGRIYIDGMVHSVELTEGIKIEGTGTEYICARVDEDIVTESGDEKLRDPAQGYDNYNMPGCHRLRARVTMYKGSESESAVIAKLIDGELALENYAPEYSEINRLLADRTYEESGSYIVDGMTAHVQESTDNSYYEVSIDKGLAYVRGYRIPLASTRKLVIEKPKEVRESILGTSHEYVSGKLSYILMEDNFVRDITEVTGTFTVYNIPFSGSGDHELTTNRLTGIISAQDLKVHIYTPEKSYEEGVDFRIEPQSNNLRIIWITSRPSSYSADVTYEKKFTSGTDYIFEESTVPQITWVEGNNPDEGTIFNVKYNIYDGRHDLIFVDQYGDIGYVQGIPAEFGYEVTPAAPTDTLPLAIIMIPPNGSASTNAGSRTITVSNIGMKRFTMNDIQTIVNRIRTLEYDQAVLSLSEEARQVSTLNSKKGILADPFLDLSHIDLNFNREYNSELLKYDAAIDLVNNLCYLPIVARAYRLSIDENKTTSNTSSRLAMLKVKGESTILSQNYATGTFNINPYSTYPSTPEITLSPNSDNSISDNVINVSKSPKEKVILSTDERLIERTLTLSGSFSAYTERSDPTTVDTFVRKQTLTPTVKDTILSTEVLTYVRPNTITIEGMNFEASLDNIHCYFEGSHLDMTPIEGTSAGSESGSVRANSDGHIKATINIPGNTFKQGIREIKLESKELINGVQARSASALYTAQAKQRNIERTTTTITQLLYNRINTVTETTYVDPLGQIFVLDQNATLKGINVYFKTKPNTNTEVVCEIRGVENGTINSTVYGISKLYPNKVNINETVPVTPTRFDFENPVILEGNKEYAFVLRSTSNSYTVWVAELGEVDKATGKQILSNPYMVGLMLSSSNNHSWTMHQTIDMKFDILAYQYEDTSSLYFNAISTTEELTPESLDKIARFYLVAETIESPATSIKWYYNNDGVSNNYIEFSPHSMVFLDKLSSTLSIKAEMTTNNPSISPVIDLNSVGAQLSRFEDKGYYITQPVEYLDPYTRVDIFVDTHMNESASLEYFINIENENQTHFSLKPLVEDSNSSRVLDNGWVERNYYIEDLATELSNNPDINRRPTSCRLVIKMRQSGEDSQYYDTPAIRRLRVIFS